MSMTTLMEQFEAVDDPRCAGKVGHRLGDILVIACAESWEDIALYGRTKRNWLQSFPELPCGVPSHDTFRRVFMRIDPNRFETAFHPRRDQHTQLLCATPDPAQDAGWCQSRVIGSERSTGSDIQGSSSSLSSRVMSMGSAARQYGTV